MTRWRIATTARHSRQYRAICDWQDLETNMKSLFCIAAILTLSTVCRAHEVAAVTSTDIRGWYIGESFQDWSKNPTLGGNADVCHGKKIPGNVKQWCKTYLAAESG